MKSFSTIFKATIGDQVRHALTGFSGAVTNLSVNETGDRMYYVESSEGRGVWISEAHLEDAVK